MSCFILNDDHVILVAAVSCALPSFNKEVGGFVTPIAINEEELFSKVCGLKEENLKSFNELMVVKAKKQPLSTWVSGLRALVLLNSFTRVEMIKLLQCAAYNSCDHEGWKSSEYKAMIEDSIEALLPEGVTQPQIKNIPGYDSAAWSL